MKARQLRIATALWCCSSLLVAGSCSDDDNEQPEEDLRCSTAFASGDTRFQQYDFQCTIGECDNGVFCDGVETCQGQEVRDVVTKRTLVCTCSPGVRPCALDERCDEELDVCVPNCDFPPDEDGDGVWSIRCGGTDCDDNDPTRYTGNPEVCDADGVDEDCDPRTFGGEDLDGDGYLDASCFNEDGDEIIGGTDCDDSNPNAHPNEAEVCNGTDDDCDGEIDEGVSVTLYVDADNDGFGQGDAAMVGCPGTPGMAPVAGDCDDTTATLFPGAFRCVTDGGQSIERCQANGTWNQTLCPSQRICYTQPGGHGVCVP